MQSLVYAIWGCMYELNSSIYNCPAKSADMSNAASTWVGIAIGGLIGLIITWWVYYRQKKTSDKQDEVIKHIKDLDEKHDALLNKMLSLEEKIDNLLEPTNNNKRVSPV